GGNESAGGAVLVFEISGDVIFDFDLVKAAELAKAADFSGHAQKPLHDVEVMKTLVEEHAAAFTLPGRAPAAAGVVGFGAEPIGHDPAHADDVAQFAALNEFLDFEIPRFGAKLEHAGKDGFGILFAGGNETFGIGFMRGDGFLDHGMDA